MSWEEYKKKREEKSSWEQYKQKREKQLQESQKTISNTQSSTSNTSNNKTSLWDNIQNIASGTGKVADNLWQGLKNEVMSLQQTVGRAANNTQANHADLINQMHKKALEGRLKDNPEEAQQINKVINNPLISGDKVREESREYYNKIQEKKNENTLKIQQNTESMNTEVGKYIAGEIAPGIGQMLPGMLPGGQVYFIGSATGNYYDDAKQRGMTEDQATKYSGIMGIIEGSLESVGAKLTTNVGKQLLKKNIKGALVNYGLDIGENFLEESIVEPLSEIMATATAGKDKADWSNIGQRMWESGIAGAITSAITGGTSGAIGAVGSKVTQQNKYVDYNTNKKLDKNTQNILKQAENIIQENNTTNSQPQLTQNIQNTPNQQIMPMQQEKTQNTISEQVKIDSDNFAKQVDAIKNGTFPQRDMLTLGKTPQVLKDIGLPDLPITMTQRHLDTIMNESGKYKNANYHGLGEEIVKQLPEAINNPLDIVKSNTKDDSIVLTTYLADKNDNTVIASIKIDGTGKINNIEIDSNVLTSAYGRNNYEKFMEENIKNGNLLYDVDQGVIKKVTGARLQLPRTSNSSTGARLQLPRRDASITNSIPPTTKNVNGNTTSNYSMPIAEKYSESNVQKYNRYKKNILDSRAKEVNNLISYKNETIRNIENKILEKQNLLNSKKDKNTKTASVLRAQIENLKTRQQRIENLYNEKIDKVNAKTNRDKINFETRNTIKKEARENLKAEISPLTEDLTKYKDKKAGILYNRETAQRNIDDIVSDKELAQAIKETIFDPIQVHQAQKTKEINRLFDIINALNLDKTKKYDYTVETSAISGEITEDKKHIKIDEATLAQLLIEKKITNQELKNDYNMSNEQIEKINKTANTFTEILDGLYNKMNEEQIKYGYSPIGKLNNYFPHFFENKPDTMLGKIASYFGIDITKQDLPTEIAGRTDIFKPGKTWNSNTLQRKTNKTDYDALKAMEKYIQGAADIIYTTEDIQKIREYERQIRYQYSDKGIQESIDDILNNSELTQEAKDSAIDGVFKNSENELSNFVTWLNDYGNTLANKKSFADRNMERNIGRNLYSSMAGVEARIASNTIGGNLSVSLTNFAPLFQAVGTTKVNYLLTGMLQTTSNNIKGIMGNKDISFVDNSNFLTNRFGTDTIADKTVTQKISDVASIPMNIIDEFTAESIVRGKYLENIDRGMTEEQALDNADKYASKLMADRSKGALPIIFNAKNPISKLTTMFQVEPNNIISNYLKDMPREATNKVELTKQVTKLMVSSYAFNTLVMAIRGGNEVLPDPVKWVSYLIKAITGDDDEKEKAEKDLAESVIGSIPFVSNLAGFGLTDLLGIDSDIGRIPISNAMPSITNIVKAFDSEADGQYRKETMMKELIKPFLYLGLPTGGAQIKKTFEGISTVSAGGSYKTDKEGNKILQFPVENPSATDYIRAGILGKYSLPMAKEYQERNFKSLSAKQTKAYEESNLPFKEYLEYIEAGLKTNKDKINYLETKEMNTEQKWGIYTNDLFSSTERKEDGGSQLSDAKYITSNGVSKSEYIKIYNKAQKNNIDMPTAEEYKEMKSNNISLSNYIDYKIKVKELTESKRKSKELSDTENLKNADKIQILLNSNYSDKEISGIYANYIKSEKDTEYDIMKATGINIKEYLKYKQQEFESDKEDDGTLTGKTISKSKQKKVVEYLNSMNIKGNQRLLLYAMQGYTTTTSQKTQLANYVQGLKIDKDTKLKLYDKFSGFTVYKNGKVEW